MNNQDTVWIVVGVIVAIIVIVGLVLLARSKRNQKHRVEAGHLREEIETENAKVEKRQALAAETDAMARAAEAEAEVKAAEAQRLRDRASSHSESVAATREDLDERRKHADHIDPDVKTGKHDDDVDRTDVDRQRDRTVEQPPVRSDHHLR